VPQCHQITEKEIRTNGLLKPLTVLIRPSSIPSVVLMNGGLPNSTTDSWLLRLESKTDSKEAKTQTEDSKTLKLLLRDNSVESYQIALQESVNGIP